MKALTIKEPWATLIIEGYKEYEFRSWKTNYRGKIVIHAGLTNENISKFDVYNLEYSKGEIIGEAYLEDCILVTDDFMASLLKKNSFVGIHHFQQTFSYKTILSNTIKEAKFIKYLNSFFKHFKEFIKI